MSGYSYEKAESFMEKIVEHVYKNAVSGTIRVIENPPGRNPSPSLVKLAEWYSNLDNESKEQVRRVAIEAADAALFGLFAAFDGIRNIGFEGEITVIEGGCNMSSNSELHELYRAIATDIFE
ncbi:MAG: hypothetical protein ACFN04_02355 [Propionibacterium acidifaciens]